jgi:hypothetical protein
MIDTALSRRAIALVGSGIVTLSIARRLRAAPRDVVFDVFRKGSKIGTHAIQFGGTGGQLKVANRLNLVVKVAFVTVYRYDQVGEDEWEGDVLVRTRVQTNDDGKDSLVVAEARGDKLAVQGPMGAYATPLGAMTDLSFWNQAITRGRPVIDSQNGELMDIEFKPSTRERIEVLGRAIDAQRFPMATTKGRSGTVWYDDDSSLVKAVVLTRGETLNYELVG